MKIIISGGSGLVGSKLIPELLAQGHTVHNLSTRTHVERSNHPQLRHHHWNPERGELDFSIVEAADAIINLAGYNLSNRWTEENKKKMIDSRLNSTGLLVKAIEACIKKPSVFITASASGYYSPSMDIQNEKSPKGNGFLSDLTADWESASVALDAMQIRRVILRIGVVLSAKEGAVAKMVPFFKLGLGSAVGSGKQWLSWIHADDLVQMIIYSLKEVNLIGVYNASAPMPISNRDFSAAFAKALHKPFILPAIPAFMLRLLFGDMASLILESRGLSADKIKAAGFKHQYPEIGPALNSLF